MLYALLAGILLGLPVVWHVRDLHSPKPIVFLCGALAGAIIVPSKTALGDLDGFGAKTCVISNPIGILNLSINDRLLSHSKLGSLVLNPLGQNRNRFKIGLVGQIIARKGHDLLLDAALAIFERVPEATIFFIGGDLFDPSSEFIQSLRCRIESSEQLHGRVIFIDYNSCIEAVYRQLDMIVVPSRSEAFGRVVLEAMHCSCPVVAARTGGLIEIIHDRRNGLLFDVDDASDLAKRVIELASCPDLRCKIVKGGQATAEAFEQKSTAISNNVKSIYFRLCKHNPDSDSIAVHHTKEEVGP